MKRFSTMCSPGADSTSTTTSSACCTRPTATRSSRATTIGAAATSSSSATTCRTFSIMTRRSANERGDVLRGEAFAGEYEPVTLSLVPLRDLGKVTVERRRA